MKPSQSFRIRVVQSAGCLAAVGLLYLPLGMARSASEDVAQLVVETGRAGCTVELDAVVIGKTDSQGHLKAENIEASDHYVHVLCPDDRQETGYLISPSSGSTAKVVKTPVAAPKPSSEDSEPDGIEPVEAKIKLRQLVQQAVQLRARGHFDEAVNALHEATKLDPENSDLHRELGITFLLNHEWNRARVEMIEALHHDPGDADAHNGLGYALEKLGRTQAALNEYRAATRLDPEDSSYREHYIEALGRLAAEQAASKKK